jgi:hypothetical protein
MTDYKKQFADYSTEYLLEKRALGDELHPDAHRAIVEIFAERGEVIPMEKASSQATAVTSKPGKVNWFSRNWVWLASIPVAMLLGKLVGGFAGSDGGFASDQGWMKFIVVGSFYVGVWKYQRLINSKARSHLNDSHIAVEDGLNELMRCAGNGELSSVETLLTTTTIDVNAKSKIGSTALMYATRNNHLAVAKLLFEHGADVNAKSAKGSSALSIAEKFGHQEMASFLRQKGAS